MHYNQISGENDIGLVELSWQLAAAKEEIQERFFKICGFVRPIRRSLRSRQSDRECI
tara:strand:- start:490 stop:660 length:171 start_codon:yes stop_codon:yes gene_type:complete